MGSLSAGRIGGRCFKQAEGCEGAANYLMEEEGFAAIRVCHMHLREAHEWMENQIRQRLLGPDTLDASEA